ncbi:retrovirus-related pol polyprotein from transposon TNT 1-94 [Tanacetum coccineum]
MSMGENSQGAMELGKAVHPQKCDTKVVLSVLLVKDFRNILNKQFRVNKLIINPTEHDSRNITETSISITDLPDPKLTQSPITHHAYKSLNIVPQDTWSRDQHIEIVNIIGEPTKGMLTRSMAAKLIVASASECLFANFLSEIEPKKVSKELKHPGWVNAMQEELNQFYRNKLWTLIPLLRGKISIGSKWVFRNKDDLGTVIRIKARLVALGFSQE